MVSFIVQLFYENILWNQLYHQQVSLVKVKLIIPQFVLVLVQKRKKENHKASTLMKIFIRSQNKLKTMDQIKQEDVSKVNI